MILMWRTSSSFRRLCAEPGIARTHQRHGRKIEEIIKADELVAAK
jgi:hypothetical protein